MLTEAQEKRIITMRRRGVTIKGVVEDECGMAIIGWERSRNGRDMNTMLGRNGHTIYTKVAYRYR